MSETIRVYPPTQEPGECADDEYDTELDVLEFELGQEREESPANDEPERDIWEMRDTLAAGALSALISVHAESHEGAGRAEHIAREAYEYADAMLEARVVNLGHRPLRESCGEQDAEDE